MIKRKKRGNNPVGYRRVPCLPDKRSTVLARSIGIGGHLAMPPTGSPEAVARPRFPQNVACRFPALRSSEDDSQHCESL